jgi:hypothetical protein
MFSIPGLCALLHSGRSIDPLSYYVGLRTDMLPIYLLFYVFTLNAWQSVTRMRHFITGVCPR